EAREDGWRPKLNRQRPGKDFREEQQHGSFRRGAVPADGFAGVESHGTGWRVRFEAGVESSDHGSDGRRSISLHGGAGATRIAVAGPEDASRDDRGGSRRTTERKLVQAIQPIPCTSMGRGLQYP